MMRVVSAILRAKSSEEWGLVCELLRRVGFADGKTWERGVSKGSAFEAPVAQVEVAEGPHAQGMPELMVEVSELESVEKVARNFSREVTESRSREGGATRKELSAVSSQLRVGESRGTGQSTGIGDCAISVGEIEE